MDEQLTLFPDDPGTEDEKQVLQDVTVIETRYFNFLMDNASKYLKLVEAGVDNWKGYAKAMRRVTTAQEGDDV